MKITSPAQSGLHCLKLRQKCPLAAVIGRVLPQRPNYAFLVPNRQLQFPVQARELRRIIILNGFALRPRDLSNLSQHRLRLGF